MKRTLCAGAALLLSISLAACSTTTALRDTARSVRNHNQDYKDSRSSAPLAVAGPHRPANPLYRIPALAPGHCTPLEACPGTIEPPDFSA